MSQECTAIDCGNPTDLYLCQQCVSDLQQWIDRVPDLRAELYITMAKLDHTAPRSHNGGGGLSSGSSMPLRESAMEARYALALWEGRDAIDLAHDQHSGGYMPMLIELITKGETLTDNPEEHFTFGICGADTETGPCPEMITALPDTVWANCRACGAPHNVKQRTDELKAKAKGEPLPPRKVRQYLQQNARITVKTKDFENWVYHRHLSYVLDSVTTDNRPKRIYFPGEVLRVHQEMCDRRNIA